MKTRAIAFAAMAFFMLGAGGIAQAQAPDGWLETEGGMISAPGMINAKPASPARSLTREQSVEVRRSLASPLPGGWRNPLLNENAGSPVTNSWTPPAGFFDRYRTEVGP